MVIQGNEEELAKVSVQFLAGVYEVREMNWIIWRPGYDFDTYTTMILQNLPHNLKKHIRITKASQIICFHNRIIRFLYSQNPEKLRGLYKDSVFLVADYTLYKMEVNQHKWDWFFIKHE